MKEFVLLQKLFVDQSLSGQIVLPFIVGPIAVFGGRHLTIAEFFWRRSAARNHVGYYTNAVCFMSTIASFKKAFVNDVK